MVPHPASLKINVAGRPEGPGGGGPGRRFRSSRAPRTPQNEEIGYVAVIVPEMSPIKNPIVRNPGDRKGAQKK